MIALLIPISLLLAIDLYFFQLVKTSVVGFPERWRLAIYGLYWLINVLVIGSLVVSAFRQTLPNHIRYYVFSIALVFIIPKLVGIIFLLGEDVFRLGSGVIGIGDKPDGSFLPSRRKFISNAGLLVASVPFGTMLYGMIRTAFQLQVKNQTVYFDDLPKAFEGLLVAQISDLHSGSFSSTQLVRKAIDKILGLKPDLVFFTGDLVNDKASEAEPFISEFKRLTAPLGVYSILGNHDYGSIGPWPSREAKAANLERLKAIHGESGWNLLLNSNKVLESGNEKLAIVGVENWGASRHFPKLGDLDKATSGIENIPFKILLSHDPSHWDAQIKEHPQKFQLTLSGHTHGAQFGIEIPGIKWSPAKYLYKQWAGLYDENDGQKIYVNRGLGFIGYLGRIGIQPEITLLELRSSKIA